MGHEVECADLNFVDEDEAPVAESIKMPQRKVSRRKAPVKRSSDTSSDDSD